MTIGTDKPDEKALSSRFSPEGTVEAEVKRLISGKGRITFAEYMEAALYSEGGYYMRGEVWGRQGDYITNLDMGPVFGKMLARQIEEMWVLLGSPGSFQVIEAGAGRGLLSKSILNALRESSPGLFDTVKFRLIEKNQNLHEPENGKISWHCALSELKSSPSCVLSNELIDSFPVHRVIMDVDGLKELFVVIKDNKLCEEPGDLSAKGISEYFDGLEIKLVPGQRAEVNLVALDWLKEAASLVERGFIITIDYGLPARELYSPERFFQGSLMCHYRHTLNDDPFKNIGGQDITAHVDFTALAKEGGKHGLGLTGFATQKNFLLGLGILDEFEDIGGMDGVNRDKIRHNQLIKELVMPNGMGDDFKVLIQHKGIEKPLLKGLSFKDSSRSL